MDGFRIKEKKDDRGQDKVRASEESFRMQVSPICHNEKGEKYAYVTFGEGERAAEGKIPDCKIIKSTGFSEDEVEVLELYMKSNLSQLKKMAATTNVARAFMKDQ